MGANINLEDWDHILRSRVKEDLVDDFRNFNIIVEADLQSSICLHLRQYISDYENLNWRVFNQLYQKSAQKNKLIYPDIILTRRKEVKLAIELKQSAGREARVPFEDVKDDVRKMGRYGSDRAIPTYVIWTVYKNDEDEKEKTQQLEKLASGFPNPPTIVIINLRKTHEHDPWYLNFQEYRDEWMELYDVSEED